MWHEFRVVTSNMEKRDEKALFELAPLIEKELNITAILSYLVKHDLTTSEEREILLSSYRSNVEKKHLFLLSWLPNKGNNSLDRFIEALKESGKEFEGTTHETLASKLQEERLAKGDEGMYILANRVLEAEQEGQCPPPNRPKSIATHLGIFYICQC